MPRFAVMSSAEVLRLLREGTGTCKSCGAATRWARTANKRLMPLNPEPIAGGNIRLDEDGSCEVLSGDALKTHRGEMPLYTSHFATCPGASSHRKAK